MVAACRNDACRPSSFKSVKSDLLDVVNQKRVILDDESIKAQWGTVIYLTFLNLI